MRQAHIGSWILSLSLLIPLTLHAQAEPPQQPRLGTQVNGPKGLILR
jgi:hypothetical protein